MSRLKGSCASFRSQDIYFLDLRRDLTLVGLPRGFKAFIGEALFFHLERYLERPGVSGLDRHQDC